MKAIKADESRRDLGLRAGWYELLADVGQLELGGIFEWQIDGVCEYVGLSNRFGQILNRTENKVRKLNEIGSSYPRTGDLVAFRDIYCKLSKAYRSGIVVRFAVLETCDPEQLTDRRRFWRTKRFVRGG
jgi:hypothetical protein